MTTLHRQEEVDVSQKVTLVRLVLLRNSVRLSPDHAQPCSSGSSLARGGTVSGADN